MKRATLAALAVVVAGALWLSASATLALGQRHDVPTLALPALVVVLEVASVIGTALWVTAENGRAQVKPTLVVLTTSGVAGVGGWQAYGWLGLVAPLGVVLVTDMIAERWHGLTDLQAPPQPIRSEEAVSVCLAPPPIRPPEQAASLEPAATRAGASDEAILAWITEETAVQGRPPGRDAVKRAWSVGTKRAERLLADRGGAAADDVSQPAAASERSRLGAPLPTPSQLYRGSIGVIRH